MGLFSKKKKRTASRKAAGNEDIFDEKEMFL